jgi:hypothetical protein
MTKKSGMLKKLMKIKSFRGKLIYLPFICLILLHMPIVFAGTKTYVEAALVNLDTENKVTDTIMPDNGIAVTDAIEAEYDSMHLHDLGLSKTAFNYAMKGFNYLVQSGKLAKDNIISIVDFSKPSSQKRLFVIDLSDLRVLYNTYVAHGVNSGKEYANQFSNTPESNKSSLGFYETKNTYLGGNGYSLKLEGLESGINDNAEKRSIVIHGAEYVDESLIRSQGYIGRSWGCPALPEKLHKPIIDKIKNGSCLFIYSPDNAYLKKSKIINA